MKKLLLLAFALILVVALCACDGGEGDTTSDTTTTAKESTTTKVEDEDTEDESDATDTESATVSDTETGVESDDESGTETTTTDETDTDVTTTDDNGGEDVTEDETDDSLGDRFNWDYSDYEQLYIGADVTKDADKGTTYGSNPVEIAPGKSVATKFTVTKGALATVCINCPSWNNWDAGDLNTGSVTMSLYYWVEGEGEAEKDVLKDGYTKTLATEPIATVTSVDHSDNAEVELWVAPLELPEGGTFLVVLSNADEEENLRIGCPISTFNCREYYSREDLTFKLPTDEAIKEAGYDPQYSSDVVCFNQNGAPAYASFPLFFFDVMFPPEE